MRNSKLYLIFILISFSSIVHAQFYIKGDFPSLAGQQVKLVGFDGFVTKAIDSVIVSEQGEFILSFTEEDCGMAYLAAGGKRAYSVVLTGENILLKGESLSTPEDVEVLEGEENKLFAQYAVEHPKREQALSTWIYLKKMYQGDSLFSDKLNPIQAIEKEIKRIKQVDADFLKSIMKYKYLSWYLPVRKLISSVPTIAQYRTEEIPSTLKAFRDLDYSDGRLFKSGLLKEAIENHCWLIENMGLPLKSVYTEMAISVDSLLLKLSENEKKFNLVTEFLFQLFEKRSLYEASEYLALKALTQKRCKVNPELANQLERYRAMKIGSIAPEIFFRGDVFKNGEQAASQKRLTEIQSEYKVVIFGSSKSQKSVDELSQLLPLYKKWKVNKVEVVFISLDTDSDLFKRFTSVFPFISYSDYKNRNSQAVKDFHVYKIPTFLLLDKNHKIILHPNSVKQIDAWVDYYLVSKD